MIHDFPGGASDKESACNLRDLGSIPWLGRSLREGNSYPLQYSCLGESYRPRSLVGYIQSIGLDTCK